MPATAESLRQCNWWAAGTCQNDALGYTPAAMAPGRHDSPSDEGSPGTIPAALGEGERRGKRAFLAGLRWVLLCAAALWLSDLALLLPNPPAHLLPTAAGLFTALFVSLGVAGMFGLVLGGILALTASPAVLAERFRLGARLRAWLLHGDPDEQVLRSGALLAAPWLLGSYALASYFVSERLVLGMARPEFVALAVLASHLLLSLCMVVFFLPLHSLGTWLALWLSRIPWLGRVCFGRTLHFALWLGGFALAALALFVRHYHEALGFLPWRELGQGAFALVCASLLSLFGGRAPRTLRITARALGWVFVLVSALSALTLKPSQLYSRQFAEQKVLSGRLGHALLMKALDADHDGYLPILGGGDCAPFDPARNPGAIDIPGNHIDEDCDGRDLDLQSLPRMGVYDLPVRADIPMRPPIVFLTIDAFAATHLHALGEKRELTPNLDALAAKSAFFRRCFAQGPSTRLSFPSIFTSRWDSQIKQRLVGGHPYPVDDSEVMLAQVMRDAGYDTVAVLSDPYFSPRHWTGITRGFSQIIETPFTTQPELDHDGPRVTEAAVQELKRAREKPLFLWVHYYDAHSPHTQPPGVPVYGETTRDLYDAELTFVDREVGKLLPEIESALGGQAVVVVTGDHGIAFDEPRHEKFNYGYDLSTAVLHVPLMVHAPFIAPRNLDGIVSTMDITPTLVNLLRLRGPFPFQGVSLLPEILEGKRSRPPVLMHQMFLEERLWKQEEPLERAALRTDRYNLMQDRKGGFFELYDYQRDYFEQNDLSLDPAYETILRDLRQELLVFTYLTRHIEPAPKPVPKPAAPHPRRPPARPARPPAQEP